MAKKQNVLTETLDKTRCTAEQHVYAVECTENGRTLHWSRVEQHRWSDWQTEQEPDCTTPGERSSYCVVCGLVRWQRSAPLGHVLEFLPAEDRRRVAVCRVCGRILWRGPAKSPARKKKKPTGKPRSQKQKPPK